jgi:hypothetical protein
MPWKSTLAQKISHLNCKELFFKENENGFIQTKKSVSAMLFLPQVVMRSRSFFRSLTKIAETCPQNGILQSGAGYSGLSKIGKEYPCALLADWCLRLNNEVYWVFVSFLVSEKQST